MYRAIIVVTYPNSPWLSDCLVSLKGVEYPVIIAMNTPEDNAYDPQGIYEAERLGIGEFVLLHDTMVVKDQSVFEILFKFYESRNVTVGPGGLMLIGKYITETLPPLPAKPTNKREAVDFELSYKNKVNWEYTLDPNFTDGPAREYKNGRENMVIENQYFKKYKGTWDTSMVQ